MADKDIHNDYCVFRMTRADRNDSPKYVAKGPLESEKSHELLSHKLSGLAGKTVDYHMEYLKSHDVVRRDTESSYLDYFTLNVTFRTLCDIRLMENHAYEISELSPTEKKEFFEELNARNSEHWNSDFDTLEDTIKNLPQP